MHIILCSHLLRDVEETCEEVLILKQGRIVHYSNLEEERRSNRRFLELELRGEADPFVAAVEELGCELLRASLTESNWFLPKTWRFAIFTASQENSRFSFDA